MIKIASEREFSLVRNSFAAFKQINLKDIGLTKFQDLIYTLTKVMNIRY